MRRTVKAISTASTTPSARTASVSAAADSLLQDLLASTSTSASRRRAGPTLSAPTWPAAIAANARPALSANRPRLHAKVRNIDDSDDFHRCRTTGRSRQTS